MKGNAPSETRADTIYEFIDTINSWLVASPLKSNFRAPARFLAYRWKINPGIVASPRLPAANIAYGAIAAKLRRGGGRELLSHRSNGIDFSAKNYHNDEPRLSATRLLPDASKLMADASSGGKYN